MYVEAREWAQKNLPPDALVVCSLFSGTLYFQTGHPILRWDIVADAAAPKYLSALQRAGQPVFAVLAPSELADPRMKIITGKWVRLADFHSMSAWKITQVDNR